MNPALPRLWYYVYLLKSKQSRRIYPALPKARVYIGCTGDLRKRLKEHIDGKVFSTKNMLPIELLYYEAYKSKDIAYKREKTLKAYGNSLIKILTRLNIYNPVSQKQDKERRAG